MHQGPGIGDGGGLNRRQSRQVGLHGAQGRVGAHLELAVGVQLVQRQQTLQVGGELGEVARGETLDQLRTRLVGMERRRSGTGCVN